jgi:FKBP-type peptidyl-prolyl cis-trans isomerase
MPRIFRAKNRLVGLRFLFVAAMVTIGPLRATAQTSATGNPKRVGSGPPAADASLTLAGFTGLGAMFVRNNQLDQLGWNDAQIAAFVDGVRAALRDRAFTLDEDATRRVGTEMIRRVQTLGPVSSPSSADTTRSAAMDAKIATEHLKAIRQRLHLQQTASGLLYVFQRPGRGARPAPDDVVVLTLEGRGPDGVTPSPVLSGEHFKARMSDLLPGLREGLQMMAVGSQALFVLPASLSFGTGPWPDGIEHGAPVTFVVTLHEVIGTAAAGAGSSP